MPLGKQIGEFKGRHTSVTIDIDGDTDLQGKDPRLRSRKFMRLSRAVAKEFLLFLALVALIGLVATPCASGQTIGKPPSQVAKKELPKEKETILRLYVTAKEAYEKWKAEPETAAFFWGADRFDEREQEMGLCATVHVFDSTYMEDKVFIEILQLSDR